MLDPAYQRRRLVDLFLLWGYQRVAAKPSAALWIDAIQGAAIDVAILVELNKTSLNFSLSLHHDRNGASLDQDGLCQTR